MKIHDILISGDTWNFTQIGTKWWELCEDVIYTITFNNGEQTRVVVPKGFKYDLASVPPIFQGLLGKKEELAIEACLLHDYAYRTHILTRSVADDSFLFIMNKYKNPKSAWKRWVMHKAVVLFGGKPYRDKT